MSENGLSHLQTPSVCVVIPVYKPVLTPYETISLTQCMRVLGHYQVVLIKPDNLDVSPLVAQYPGIQVRVFANEFFGSVQGYNRLMLSEVFYTAFADVEYILIHQLDAFVFRDELANWCRAGYDYVGAPWLRDRDFSNWREEAWFNAKKRIAILFNLKKEDGITPREITGLNGVGNGGFTLRRVAALHRWLRFFRHKLETYEQIHAHQYNEDVFWGVEVNRYLPLLRIPDFRTALRFSVEFYPDRAIAVYTNGQLPFGCHAWDIHGTDYWRPIFAEYGYTI